MQIGCPPALPLGPNHSRAQLAHRSRSRHRTGDHFRRVSAILPSARGPTSCCRACAGGAPAAASATGRCSTGARGGGIPSAVAIGQTPDCKASCHQATADPDDARSRIVSRINSWHVFGLIRIEANLFCACDRGDARVAHREHRSDAGSASVPADSSTSASSSSSDFAMNSGDRGSPRRAGH